MSVVAPRRWNRKKSQSEATTVSAIEIALVSAAKRASAKNATATTDPPGSAAKTCGSETNMSPTPAVRASSSPPNANAGGMMIAPASTATKVSMTPMRSDDRPMSADFGM